jgi:PAS domain S-box-containing protein
MTRETFLLIILLIFSSMIVIMLATFGLVVWKVIFVVRHLRSMKILMETMTALMVDVKAQIGASEALLQVVKSYLALVHAERRDSKQTIIEKSRETQQKVELKGEEIKQEIRTVKADPDAEVLAIITADEQGIITEWSAGATRLFHWKAEEAIGRDITIITPPHHRDAHVNAFRRAVQERRGPKMTHPLQLSAMTREGEEIPVVVTLAGWLGDRGMIYSALIRRQ